VRETTVSSTRMRSPDPFFGDKAVPSPAGLAGVGMTQAEALSRFGVYLFPWGKQPPTVRSLVDLALHAEALGYHSLHVPWHFTLPRAWIFPEFGNRYLLDPLVVLPAIVERTSRIRVSLNAAILPLLHPFFWAQYTASLDVHSGGRTIAGVAVGWWEEDFRIGLSSLQERGARMDESLEVLARLWAGESIEEPGRFWDVSGLTLDPKPVQQPLPIWIGGGEKSIGRAARHASCLMPLDMSPTAARRLRSLLDQAAGVHGRAVALAMMSYLVVADDDRSLGSEIRAKLRRLTAFEKEAADVEETLLVGRPSRVAEQVRRFFDCGVDYIVLDCQFHGWESEAFAKAQMTRFAEEVVPLL
jgi:alkanesulfonate monooxygenase SsuD/methylene tetrahydromethanopterin reductase-like flavin-dependent oxidoreductase (luciferase family)